MRVWVFYGPVGLARGRELLYGLVPVSLDSPSPGLPNRQDIPGPGYSDTRGWLLELFPGAWLFIALSSTPLREWVGVNIFRETRFLVALVGFGLTRCDLGYSALKCCSTTKCPFSCTLAVSSGHLTVHLVMHGIACCVYRNGYS